MDDDDEVELRRFGRCEMDMTLEGVLPVGGAGLCIRVPVFEVMLGLLAFLCECYLSCGKEGREDGLGWCCVGLCRWMIGRDGVDG